MPHTHNLGLQLGKVATTVALVFAALLYFRGSIRIRCHKSDSVQGWRAASFLLGVFFTWLATASAISALDHEILTVHMVQHLLLLTLAPPLMWLGDPVKPLSKGLPQRLVERSRPFLRLTPAQRRGTIVAQPAVCWVAGAGTLIGWHIPFLFAFGMRSETWHGIEQASFLSAGLLFWWPVIRRRRSASDSSDWTMLVYLFLATLPCDILSGFLVFCDRVVYPMYSSSPHPSAPGFSALEDQQCAGALMWTCVTVVYLIAGVIYAVRLLSPNGPRQSCVATSDRQLGTMSPKTPWTTEIA